MAQSTEGGRARHQTCRIHVQSRDGARSRRHFLASFEASAVSLGVEPVAMPVRSDAEIEIAIAALGAEQAGLVEFGSFLAAHMGTVISSATRHNVPATYENALFA